MFQFKSIKTGLVFFILAQILFLFNLQFPTKLNFDEFHYVAAAKHFLVFDQIPNMEHPPLAKIIMAAGIKAFGDNPLGWRIMSTLFGSLTLVGMYFLALAIFNNDEKYARWVASLTLVNQLLYVQSRIGMLDTFMFCFLVWSLVFFVKAWNAKDSVPTLKSLISTGILFGLAIACKWFAVVPLIVCLGLSFLTVIAKNNQFSSVLKKYKLLEVLPVQISWENIGILEVFVCFLLIPFLVYSITFIPYLFFISPMSIHSFFQFQKTMWQDQLSVHSFHPYMSHWWDWPLLKRPIWYAFDPVAGGVRGVLLLGNPLVMWFGILSIIFSIWSFIKFRSREAFLISVFYLSFFGSWIVIPRKVSFYYYYYPAGMILSLAIAYLFFKLEDLYPKKLNHIRLIRTIFLILSILIFIYFFPILSASKIHDGEFHRWMWIKTWI